MLSYLIEKAWPSSLESNRDESALRLLHAWMAYPGYTLEISRHWTKYETCRDRNQCQIAGEPAAVN